jgi:hypothetical protein
LVFIDNLRVSQIKLLEITHNANKKDGKTYLSEIGEIKDTLNKIDIKPLNSHLLLISEKIKFYIHNIQNAKGKHPKIKKEKPQSSKVLINKPSFFLDSQQINLDPRKDKAGFLTSQRQVGLFSKGMKNNGEKPKTNSLKTINDKNQLNKSHLNTCNNNSSKKIIKLDTKEESIENAKKRMLLQQNRLLQITHTHGVLNDSMTPEPNIKNTDKAINSAGKHYMINNVSSKQISRINSSKRGNQSVKNNNTPNNSIRKTLIDLTSKKYKNEESPYNLSQKSQKVLKQYDRNSNRFQRSTCSIKNTTSSSSGSKKVFKSHSFKYNYI